MDKRALSILMLFGVLSAIGLYYHELFLDEAHHFLVSRDSGSISEMYANLRYDGHPRLWGGLLFYITHYITTDPAGMKILQWVNVLLTATVLLRYGPFPLWMKVLILAGYYFLYEYDVLSRNYAIGVWMLFLCCQLLRDAERNAWRIGVLIFFMCSAHLFFAFASVGILLYLLMTWRERRWKKGRMIGLGALISIGLLLAIIQAQTPVADNMNMRSVHPAEWLSPKNFLFTAGAVVQGWLPVPQVSGGRFWNSGWIGAHSGAVGAVMLSVALLVFPVFYLRKKVAAAIFYYSTTGLLLVVFVATQMTANRYFGMVFIFFLAAAWLTAGASGEVLDERAVPGGAWVRRSWWLAWVGILGIQVAVGLYAYEEDLRRPFSQSRNAAKFIRDLGVDRRRIVVDGYTAGAPLSVYLREKLWNLSTGAEASFCVWRPAYFPSPRPSIGTEFALYPGLRTPGEFILVSDRDLGRAATDGFRLTPLKSFVNSIVGENYYIYQVDVLR
jgi:hypothetical protein